MPARCSPTTHEPVTLHGDPEAPLRGPVSVLGPGTGLGVALLVGSHPHGWHAVETEGGHVIIHPHPGLLGTACALRAPEL